MTIRPPRPSNASCGSWSTLKPAESSLPREAARNYRALRSRGHTVRKTIDCLIATFCIREHHSLLHRDRDLTLRDVLEFQSSTSRRQANGREAAQFEISRFQVIPASARSQCLPAAVSSVRDTR